MIVNSVVSNEDLVESLISEPEEKMFSNLGLNETMVKKSSIEDVGKVKDTVQKLFPECVLKK